MNYWYIDVAQLLIMKIVRIALGQVLSKVWRVSKPHLNTTISITIKLYIFACGQIVNTILYGSDSDKFIWKYVKKTHPNNAMTIAYDSIWFISYEYTV